MTLTIAVILPTHDRPEALDRAVASIMAQTRPPDELIIVDDGRRAAGPGMAERVASAGIAFKYEHRDRPSLPASRNRGVAVADSDLIVFSEDDVVMPPHYLAEIERLYELDSAGLVAGIGAAVTEPGQDKPGPRVWRGLAAAMGQGRWFPRRCAARYLPLPPALRGRLQPARRLSGGAMSLRRCVAASEPFDEALSGYALGEDREYCFRLGRLHPLFVAPGLTVSHEPCPLGRPDMYERGRMYVANSLHIARRSTDGGAGTYLLVAYELAGIIILYAAWGLLVGRAGNLRFAGGMAAELLSRARGQFVRLLGLC